jgi:tetraacyldisaccharide 4'-kinase
MRVLGKIIHRAFARVSAPNRKDLPARAAGVFLLLLSCVYSAAAGLHRKLSRPKRLARPVISVGNIVCGGAGKTPAVRLIADMLLSRGHKPAVLSRGYMGGLSGGCAVVSDGKKLLTGAAEGGDEPVMLAESLPGAVVISGKDRFRTGGLAVEKFGASCVILDDGFQHHGLARDLDIVLIDSTSPFGNGRLLPLGVLREKPESLRRADLLVLTRVDFCDDLNRVRKMLFKASGGKPAVETVHAPAGFICIKTGEKLSSDGLDGKKAAALSGIGNPDLFEKMLAAQGISVVKSFRFPDHYPYSPVELSAVWASARASGAECIITTCKDAVRIKESGAEPDIKIYAAEIRLLPVRGEEELTRRLFSCLKQAVKR